MNSIRRWLRDPLFLLCLVASLAAIAVQSGELGTADTMHRLQTVHSFWTTEPAVFPEEYPEFGVHGRGGRLYDWYGIGQPLLMMVPDVLGTYLERLPIFAKYNGNDPSIRNIVVMYSTNILLSVLTVLVCFRFLRQLKFTVQQAAAGVLALLFCTTHLHYTQNMMENNYILLLTLAGFSFQFEWLQTGSRRALLIGSTCFGLNLLTRLTTGMDLMAGGAFLLLVVWFKGIRKPALLQLLFTYLITALPVYGVFLLGDRWYQYHRFGSWLGTYVGVFTQERKHLYPWLPAKYPFETPFHVGFLGPLISPEKSIFLFDPLLILVIVAGVFAWRRFRPEVKAYIITSFALLLVYISFYARYTIWSGDFAWGDRYVSTTAELAAFISVPLLLRYREQLGQTAWNLGIGLIGVSAAIQIASLAFWLSLEIYQMMTIGQPTFVIALRFKNIVAFALGRMNQWGLYNYPMTQDTWDYLHVTTWNFLPFVLRRMGVAPKWVLDSVFTLWNATQLALGGSLWQLWKVLRQNESDFRKHPRVFRQYRTGA